MPRLPLASTLGRLHGRYQDWRYGRVDPQAPIGRQGEQVAARLLRQKGLVVIAESESDRGGEIDVIAADKRTRTMVFVEVKTLRTLRPGHPADRVDANKQTRITRAALRFLKRRNLLGTPCRFDVVAIWWPDGSPQPTKIQHYEHAFEAAGEFDLWS
ncbi:YraN family protein [Stieleria sp. TO1_6]|uniref:YraN family protein n=1 Tax=Stieleria tagensis TaxID=2956795 RepID=UPI00209AA566|nr:YraN family protein [Stieleria tagensis]MCO8120166.1 YraN family protein [Stieleria tagensis]